MLGISKTAGYAILALSFLDRNQGEWILEKHLAQTTGISKPYLSKLLNLLRKYGYIKGKRGYKGGVALNKPAAEIKVSDVIEVIDGNNWQKMCILNLPGCPENCHCPLHSFWIIEREKIQNKLLNLSIRQFNNCLPR